MATFFDKSRREYLTIIKNNDDGCLHVEDWKVFEYCWAILYESYLWEQCPLGFLDPFDLPHERDYGIDLISYDRCVASQVKLYGEKSMVTWSDMANFISLSDVCELQHMKLLTTRVAKIDSLAMKSFEKKRGEVVRTDLKECIHEVLEKYGYLIETVKEEIVVNKKMEDRFYQTECVKMFLNSNKKTLKYSLACGLGKTYIVVKIIQAAIKLNPKALFLMVVPWIDLAVQTVDVATKNGITVSMIGGGKSKQINDWNLLVCVSGSIQKVVDMRQEFQYVFIDEAHHVENGQKRYDDIQQIKKEKELLLSATFRGPKEELDFYMGLREGIDEGYLSDYRFRCLYFTSGDRTKSLLLWIVENQDLFPMFLYFNSTERAKAFDKLLKEQGVRSEYLIGTDNKKKRKRVEEEVKGGHLNVLCLCGVYNEGVSFNNLKTVVFADLRHSDVNRIQVAMRGSRKHDTKPFFNVVVPFCSEDDWEDDMKDVLETFFDIDEKLKQDFDSRRGDRFRLEIDGGRNAKKRREEEEGFDSEEEEEEALLLYEEVYNSVCDVMKGLEVEEWEQFCGVKERAKKREADGGQRMPRCKGEHVPDEERKDYHWVDNRTRRGCRCEKTMNDIKAFFPELFTRRLRISEWDKWCGVKERALKRVAEGGQRKPRKRKDATEEEKRDRCWLDNKRKHVVRIDPKLKNDIDEVFPGWLKHK